MLRFRVTNAEGRRVEHTVPVGLVAKFPKESDAWCEVDRLGLGVRINGAPAAGRVLFSFLAEHYLKADFGEDAVRPKSVNTTQHVECVVRQYLIPRFGDEIAEDIKPLDIQRWFKSLHTDKALAWTTISKMRGILRRIYKVGIVHGHASRNPVEHVETRSKTGYRAIVITPAQTLAILHSLPSLLHFTLVLTCSATALRASEMLSLRWADVLWEEERIRISKRWAKGEDGETKTETSDGYVPLHPVLAHFLREWRAQTSYAADEDFVFPSLRTKGRVPLSASIFVADYLRPAAKKAGICIKDGQRFGPSQPASQPKQLAGEQGEDRTQDRARNPAPQQNPDDARSLHAGRQRRNTRRAGGIFDGARSQYEYGAVRCGLDCGLRFLGQHPVSH